MPPTPPPIVEIAVDNLPDALAAHGAGADRIELCTDLAAQGLSASTRALADFRVASNIPIAAMIRPRAGNFIPSPCDHVLAPRQAQALLAAGADGIVFGFLTPKHTVDVKLCARLVEVAGAADTVFHRAFDLIEDPLAAIDQLIQLGVKRILTAGMSPETAAHSLGLPCGPYIPDSFEARLLAIRRYIDRASGRIQIIPCGGIRANNVAQVLADTGATQLHSACRVAGADRLDKTQVRDLITAVKGV